MMPISIPIWDNWDNAQHPPAAQALGFVTGCKASSPPPKCPFPASGIGGALGRGDTKWLKPPVSTLKKYSKGTASISPIRVLFSDGLLTKNLAWNIQKTLQREKTAAPLRPP